MKKRMILQTLLLLIVGCVFCATSAGALETNLRVGYNRNNAPYHFVDEAGSPVGLHIDILEHIVKDTGYQLEFFPMDNNSEGKAALEQGDIDILLGVKPQTAHSAWASVVLSEETLCTLVPSNVRDADTKNLVSALQVDTLTPAIASKLETQYSIGVSNQKRLVDLLMDGKAEMIVGVKESFRYYLLQAGVESDYTIINNYLGTVSFVAQMPKNDFSLIQFVEDSVGRLRLSETYEEICNRWLYHEEEEEGESPVWLRNMVLCLAIVSVIVGVYAAGLTYIRTSLKRQVAEQTVMLQEANREVRQHLEQLQVESGIRNRIIRHSRLGMVLFDETYRVNLINDSALALCGQTEKQATDVRKLKVFKEIVLAHEADIFSREQAGNPAAAETITLSVRGKQKQYRYSIQKLMKAGAVKDVLLTVEEITDEETRRQELFEKEKSELLNQVVAGIAHEIKNPLTAIRTFSEAIREAGDDPAFLEDFTNYVPAEVNRINRLVESLIGYARPAKSVKNLFDLSELMQECVFFAESSNHRTQIVIHSSIEAGHKIFGSRDQAKQVVINIVLNGIESMREKLDKQKPEGELAIRISLADEDGSSVITIRDEGMGMTKRLLERCMDPFFTGKRTGTGLGLTLSNQYVQENNGQLRISSEPDAYTEVRIMFRREYDEIEDSDRR